MWPQGALDFPVTLLWALAHEIPQITISHLGLEADTPKMVVENQPLPG